MAMAGGQSTEDHNMQMIRQLIIGTFSTVLLKKLNQKAAKVGILDWLPMGVQSMKLASNNVDHKETREAQQAKQKVK